MSGYVGVQINGIDTYKQWGLILLADLKIGTPSVKSNLIEIPGRDGTVNMSYVISDGEPVYENRTIAFTLFKATDEETFDEIHSQLMVLCHGRECTLRLPTDHTHYYKGLFNVDGTEGYASGTIPVSVTADPYVYKNGITELNYIIPDEGKMTVILSNELRRTVPTFNASDTVTIGYKGAKYTVNAGTTEFSNVKLPAGDSEIVIEGAPGSCVTVSYQEARL